MSWTEAYTNTATIGSTEYSLTNNSTTIATRTTKGTYQVAVDFSALAAGDQYELRILEAVRSGGTQRRIMSATIAGTSTEAYITPSIMLGNGWDITVRKIAGTDRSIQWSVRAYQ